MNARRRRLLLGGLLCLLAAGGGPAAAATAATEVTVTVTGLRTGNGIVACALFDSAATFLEPGQQRVGRRVPAAAGSVTVTFPGVPPGDYAVVAYHDENANEELDRNILGVPIEGLGFSNGQRPSAFGPPTFDAVKVPIGGDGATAIAIEIHY